jgi:hypothetical protein
MEFLVDNKKIEFINTDTHINTNQIEEMDLTKLSKIELLSKCEELGITKCKSKNKGELIAIIQKKISQSQTSQSEITDLMVENDPTDITNEVIPTHNLENENKNEVLKFILWDWRVSSGP